MTEPSEQSQELFRLVVENVHDFAVYTKDLEGRTRCNVRVPPSGVYYAVLAESLRRNQNHQEETAYA